MECSLNFLCQTQHLMCRIIIFHKQNTALTMIIIHFQKKSFWTRPLSNKTPAYSNTHGGFIVLTFLPSSYPAGMNDSMEVANRTRSQIINESDMPCLVFNYCLCCLLFSTLYSKDSWKKLFTTLSPYAIMTEQQNVRIYMKTIKFAIISLFSFGIDFGEQKTELLQLHWMRIK